MIPLLLFSTIYLDPIQPKTLDNVELNIQQSTIISGQLYSITINSKDTLDHALDVCINVAQDNGEYIYYTPNDSFLFKKNSGCLLLNIVNKNNYPKLYREVNTDKALANFTLYPLVVLTQDKQKIAWFVDNTTPLLYEFNYSDSGIIIKVHIGLTKEKNVARFNVGEIKNLSYPYFRSALDYYYKYCDLDNVVLHGGLWGAGPLNNSTPDNRARLKAVYNWGIKWWWEHDYPKYTNYVRSLWCESCIYIEPQGTWMFYANLDSSGKYTPKDVADALRAFDIAYNLSDTAKWVEKGIKAYNEVEGYPKLKHVANVVEESAIKNSEDTFIVSLGYGASNISCSPTLRDTLGRFYFGYQRTFKPYVDSSLIDVIFLDSYATVQWNAISDYKRSNWKYIDAPLTYDLKTKKPVMFVGAECWQGLADLDSVRMNLPSSKRFKTMINCPSYPVPYYLMNNTEIVGLENPIWQWGNSYIQARVASNKRQISTLMGSNRGHVTNPDSVYDRIFGICAVYKIWSGVSVDSLSYDMWNRIIPKYIEALKTIDTLEWVVNSKYAKGAPAFIEEYGIGRTKYLSIYNDTKDSINVDSWKVKPGYTLLKIRED